MTMHREAGMDAVYLRALETGDLDRTHKWHNDPALYGSLGGTYRYVARSSEEEWLRGKCAYCSDQVNLAVCLSDTDEHIGNIYLQDIDWIARRAEVHMFIGESGHRSKGYGTAALRKLLRHAFEDLGLQRVYLSVLDDNNGAIRAYEKCGFMVEGKLRRHAFKNGEFRDLLIMGICTGDAMSTDV